MLRPQVLVARIHFSHAGFIDLCALIDSSLSCIFLVLLLKLLMQNILFLLDYLCLFLFEFLEPHDKPFESPLVCLLEDEVLNCWI